MLTSRLPVSLALIAFHETFLQREQPDNHLLFCTPLFQEGYCSELRLVGRYVVCRPHHADDITPTCIPPHIGILAGLDNVKMIFRVFEQDFGLISIM